MWNEHMGIKHNIYAMGAKMRYTRYVDVYINFKDIHCTYRKSMAFVVMSSIFFRNDLNVQKSQSIVSTNSAKLSFHKRTGNVDLFRIAATTYACYCNIVHLTVGVWLHQNRNQFWNLVHLFSLDFLKSNLGRGNHETPACGRFTGFKMVDSTWLVGLVQLSYIKHKCRL